MNKKQSMIERDGSVDGKWFEWYWTAVAHPFGFICFLALPEET